jgi:hypothetical protein
MPSGPVERDGILSPKRDAMTTLITVAIVITLVTVITLIIPDFLAMIRTSFLRIEDAFTF